MTDIEFYCWDELDTGNFGHCFQDLGAMPCSEDEGSESNVLGTFFLFVFLM